MQKRLLSKKQSTDSSRIDPHQHRHPPVHVTDAHADADADECDPVDLSLLLAPLSRPQLELFVATLLSNPKYPNGFNELVQFIEKVGIDRKEINQTLTSALEDVLANEVNLNHLTSEAEIFIDRANDYISAKSIHNACEILTEVSQFMIGFTKDSKRFSTSNDRNTYAHEEYKIMESFFCLLENAWQTVFEKCIVADGIDKQPSDSQSLIVTKEMIRQYLGQLEEWRRILTVYIGPVMSDAIRMAKKKVGDLSAATTTQTTTSSQPPAKKQKK